ncbi:hypothetical protein ABUW04_09485 [Streptacidiphilus sp. N1-10]|uniref:Uncharacterized protein n=1 Tax=Streptacidiphilus jeojiensis TaxID=3229225 RepID=A0ABV6XJQ3_9ACTN
MTDFQIHTVRTAPAQAQQALAVLDDAFGFVPNGAGLMANSPTLLNTFLSAFSHFRGAGTFTPAERQVLLLSNAVANTCAWAVAFHSLEALADGVELATVQALRKGDLPADPRMAALSTLTTTLIARRGHLDDTQTAAFLAAGFTRSQLLEVVTGVAISTMTNHTANLAHPPLEAPVQPHAWTEAHVSDV